VRPIIKSQIDDGLFFGREKISVFNGKKGTQRISNKPIY